MTDAAAGRVCVLSSSSSGNCSVLVVRDASGAERVVLIDMGLSPRRTRALLACVGLPDLIPDAVLLTHLDHDHWHAGWSAAMPHGCTVHVHRRHRGRASRSGLAHLRTGVFEGQFELFPGVSVSPLLVGHDDLGAAAFRFEFAASGGSLGFVTDTGRPTQDLCDHVSGVGVLAIESNYCPLMQLASNRPDFLKHRIMGGTGHLSNAQSADVVKRVAPRDAIILLHLSRQCNTQEAATLAHRHAPCRLVLAAPDGPTEWIDIPPAPSGPRPAVRRAQPLLWSD